MLPKKLPERKTKETPETKDYLAVDDSEFETGGSMWGVLLGMFIAGLIAIFWMVLTIPKPRKKT